MSVRVKLAMGALAPSIADQLARQGLSTDHAERLEKARNAASLLHIHGFLTDAECARVRGRIVQEAADTAKAPPPLASLSRAGAER